MTRWLHIAIGFSPFLVSLANGADVGQSDRVLTAATPEVLDDFALTDQDGHTFKFSNLRGNDTLVFFGFTHCPNVCPAAMFKLKLLTESLRKEGGPVPTVVLVSVDGDRDTPEVMKQFVGKFSDKFIGLTGDPRVVRNIAAEFKAVFFKGLPSDNSGNYVVEHSSQIYLVDAQGRLRTTFYDAPVEAMAQAMRGIDKHES